MNRSVPHALPAFGLSASTGVRPSALLRTASAVQQQFTVDSSQFPVCSPTLRPGGLPPPARSRSGRAQALRGEYLRNSGLLRQQECVEERLIMVKLYNRGCRLVILSSRSNGDSGIRGQPAAYRQARLYKQTQSGAWRPSRAASFHHSNPMPIVRHRLDAPLRETKPIRTRGKNRRGKPYPARGFNCAKQTQFGPDRPEGTPAAGATSAVVAGAVAPNKANLHGSDESGKCC